MGYYTRHRLEISPETPAVWEEIQKHDYMSHALGPDGNSGERCKWYEHEEQMAELSKKFPEVLFTLHGEGEDAMDLWIHYFKNGKIQRRKAKITFEPMTQTGWHSITNPKEG